ncbi:hypothetical protein MHW47_08210 [Streptomyces sp. OfavH-34-F]|uniref:hypothetical protein n=1 Tax=Streptomyces sp. OfavH-34-F TaxID=2917760 RepID=UPI001EF22AA6|nr:hypothetical protein [Streptomyces sp. OfavH-34-F]MCG7524417.1 hypothetical protein [Streptomyces sp. OfavH-34-F]
MAMARRPLLTAITAGTLLCALWFVPSANASDETGGAPATSGGAAASGGEPGSAALAETGGGVDTTPYLLGGAAFLGMGAGLVTYSARRAGPRPAL